MKKGSQKTNKQVDLRKVPLMFPIKFAEDGSIPKEIHVLPVGEWDHPAYGPMAISETDVADFVQNFNAEIRKGVPITEGHEVMDEKPAVGWFKELIDKGADGLFAVVEWTKQGKTLLAERSYKFFSPEFFPVYEDPETREITKNVLVGGALTNKPYFKELEAIVFSEPKIENQFNFSNSNQTTMQLEEILKKDVAELTDEERDFLREHKADLNDEQLATFGSVFEDADNGDDNDGDNADGDGANDDDAGNGDGDDAGDDNNDDDGGEGANDDDGKKEASEKIKKAKTGQMVQVDAGELKALQSMANQGARAFDELRRTKIESEANALVFSEQNSQGRFLPKTEKQVFNFMLGLTDSQRKAFAEIVKAIPQGSLFSENGHGGDTEGTAVAELGTKVEAAMKDDNKLTYSDAVRQVLSKNPDLSARYRKETGTK